MIKKNYAMTRSNKSLHIEHWQEQDLYKIKSFSLQQCAWLRCYNLCNLLSQFGGWFAIAKKIVNINLIAWQPTNLDHFIVFLTEKLNGLLWKTECKQIWSFSIKDGFSKEMPLNANGAHLWALHINQCEALCIINNQEDIFKLPIFNDIHLK